MSISADMPRAAQTLGILGGGQLAGMMLPVARRLGIHTVVLDRAGSPAEALCDEFLEGSPLDREAVVRLGARAGIVTFEIEGVNADALAELEALGVTVRPSSSVIRTVQDKGLQKEFFSGQGLPTAEYALVESPAKAAALEHLFPAMVKLRRGGYDGRGVFAAATPADLHGLPALPVVVERRLKIEREISVIVARGADGAARAFPPVEMVFDPKRNQLDYLISPSPAPQALQNRTVELAIQVADRLGVVGLLAVEFLITAGGEVWINEVSPRLHNSGHHTIAGARTSQFEQFLRAVMGWPLGPTDLQGAAC
ncbi:MAG TPA: ATP-grasp domain-containing protein, partial [Bdellovibrionota bacterium]|nr:ATP-grasp domain-containing protein [Bdellovibrionota bacterium]